MPSPIRVTRSPRRAVPSARSRDVDGEQVHRHAAGNGTALPRDDHLGCGFAPGGTGRPQEAVGIADRDDRDAARARGGEGCAVTDVLALVDRAHLDDPALELDHRAHGVFPTRRRIDAVKRNARPNQVAVHGAAEKYAGGIGKRGRHPAIEDADFAKQTDLPVVHRMIGRLGAGEMAHQQRETVIFGLQARSDGDRLVDRDTEPVHAGIDVERGAAAPVPGGDEGIPFGKFGCAVDDRPQMVVCERLRRARHHPVEHVDGRVGRDRPHASSFRDIGDEEGPAPGLGQHAGDRFEAAAIGIGLDHRGALDRHGRARQHLPVGRDRGEVDGEDTARFHCVGSSGRHRGRAQGRDRGRS